MSYTALQPLRRFHQPDISNEVVHLTGRLGTANAEAPEQIRTATPEARLVSILVSRRIRAFNPFGGLGYPVVAFTEGTVPGLAGLVAADHRYAPWGIGFTKDFIFGRGGGPALYIRGDQWATFAGQASMLLKSFGTRFWPGVVGATPGEPSATATTSEGVHDREWRVPVPLQVIEAGSPAMRFTPADVKLLLLPLERDLASLLEQLDNVASANLAHLAAVALPAGSPFRIFRRE